MYDNTDTLREIIINIKHARKKGDILMKGAIIGDIVGSVYEFDNIKTKDFDFFSDRCFATDDTVLTIAVADAFLALPPEAPDAAWSAACMKLMLHHSRRFSNLGYGSAFRKWFDSKHPKPYFSCGNGSAMRVSPVAYAARSLEDCERLAKLSAEITHNHPDGICGAQATAGAVYLARQGATKQEILAYVCRYYPITRRLRLESVRPNYKFDHYASICEGTVPFAVAAFMEADGFEDTIRNTISIGGDSDTLAAISGAIAEAYYGIPEGMWDQALKYFPFEIDRGLPLLPDIVDSFYSRYVNK